MLQFQSEAPLIHILYPKLGEMLFNLLSKFIRKEKLYLDMLDLSSKVDVSDLKVLDLNNRDNQVSLKSVEVGTKAKIMLNEEHVSLAKKSDFRKDCLGFYINSVSYLLEKLPLENSILKHAQYLHPRKRMDVRSINAISNLSLNIGECLKSVLGSVFLLKENENNEDLCDLVRSQWRMYQCEDESKLPSFAGENNNNNQESKEPSRGHYWEEAYKAFDLEVPPKVVDLLRIDTYWAAVGKMTDDSNKLKYPQLFALVKSILSLSHGNSTPERGFSINKYMLSIHGGNIDNDTLVALRMVKDHLLVEGGTNKVDCNRQLLTSVKQAYGRYVSDLEAKRLMDEKTKNQAKEREAVENEENERKEALAKLSADITMRKNGLKVAEDSIEEGSAKLQQELTAPKISRGRLQQAQSMIDMGLSRKRLLEDEIKSLQDEKKRYLSLK